jgi:hypothetical protein
MAWLPNNYSKGGPAETALEKLDLAYVDCDEQWLLYNR